MRVGTVFSVQPNDHSGVILSGQLYFKAFVPPRQNYLANTLLRPRLFVGGNLATANDGVSQVYGGLTWHFPVYDPFFLEASFGGTYHDGPLESPGDGLDLGCHWLFHERLGVGVDLGEHWRSSPRRTIPRTPISARTARPATAASPMPASMSATGSEIA